MEHHVTVRRGTLAWHETSRMNQMNLRSTMWYKRRQAPERTYSRVPFIWRTKRGKTHLWLLKSAWWIWVAVSWEKPRRCSSGTGKGLFLDLDIGYMDGSVFEHVIGLHTYDKCIFLWVFWISTEKLTTKNRVCSPTWLPRTPCSLALSRWYQVAWPPGGGFIL